MKQLRMIHNHAWNTNKNPQTLRTMTTMLNHEAFMTSKNHQYIKRKTHVAECDSTWYLEYSRIRDMIYTEEVEEETKRKLCWRHRVLRLMALATGALSVIWNEELAEQFVCSLPPEPPQVELFCWRFFKLYMNFAKKTSCLGGWCLVLFLWCFGEIRWIKMEFCYCCLMCWVGFVICLMPL